MNRTPLTRPGLMRESSHNLAARTSPMLILVVAIVASFVNQSGIVGGINLSFADPLMAVGLFLFILERRLITPPAVVVSFAVVLVTTTTTALVNTPLQFDIIPDERAILADIAKLTTCLLYLVFGYSIARAEMSSFAIRWFAFAATIVALAGTVVSSLGMHQFDQILFFGGSRYRGLMNDPNFYSILSCAALAYFMRIKSMPRLVRFGSIAVLIWSVLLSGSKTGFIALLSLAVLALFDYVWIIRKSVLLISLLVASCLGILFSWNQIASTTMLMAARLGADTPQIERISKLFIDSTNAGADDGSVRDAVWQAATQVIATDPLFGVGIGSYTTVTEQLSGRALLAHNTYLQLAAEWGLPLTAFFLVWLAMLIVRGSGIAYRSRAADLLILRDMIVVFMIGSLALSLNNARMFWLFLGMMMCLVAVKQRPLRTDP